MLLGPAESPNDWAGEQRNVRVSKEREQENQRENDERGCRRK